jgi:hypothetical protein
VRFACCEHGIETPYLVTDAGAAHYAGLLQLDAEAPSAPGITLRQIRARRSRGLGSLRQATNLARQLRGTRPLGSARSLDSESARQASVTTVATEKACSGCAAAAEAPARELRARANVELSVYARQGCFDGLHAQE